MSNVAERSIKMRRELTTGLSNVKVIDGIDKNSFSGEVGIQPD